MDNDEMVQGLPMNATIGVAVPISPRDLLERIEALERKVQDIEWTMRGEEGRRDE